MTCSSLPSDLLFLGFEREYSPLFVTWNKRSFAYTQEDANDQVVESVEEDEEEDEEDVSLRGCIGTFTALPLEKGLREYAITR
jgi:AMMECR1 domain-containing protein